MYQNLSKTPLSHVLADILWSQWLQFRYDKVCGQNNPTEVCECQPTFPHRPIQNVHVQYCKKTDCQLWKNFQLLGALPPNPSPKALPLDSALRSRHLPSLTISGSASESNLIFRPMPETTCTCMWSNTHWSAIGQTRWDQVSSFPSVIGLMKVWRCLCWLTVKLSVREVQHYLCFFVKCPRNCCLVMVSLKSLLFNNNNNNKNSKTVAVRITQIPSQRHTYTNSNHNTHHCLFILRRRSQLSIVLLGLLGIRRQVSWNDACCNTWCILSNAKPPTRLSQSVCKTCTTLYFCFIS